MRKTRKSEPEPLPQVPGAADEPELPEDVSELLYDGKTFRPPTESEPAMERRRTSQWKALEAPDPKRITLPRVMQQKPETRSDVGAPASATATRLPAKPGAQPELPTPVQLPEPLGAAGPPTNEWRFDRSLGGDVPGDAVILGERYRVLGGVGAGGMARVFEVEHLKLGKTFALKLIHTEQSTDPRMLRFFLREARVLSQLAHPNIVPVTDFGTDERYGAYLVMEYLKGEPLKARLRRERRLGIALSLHVALQIAEALHYMHDQQLIHCDVKPDNVFLCRPPAARRQLPVAQLIDFGLSRSMAQGAELARSEVGGTPLYAAPEQIAGLAPEPSMDIYAVGVLLYEMVAGRPPFVGRENEVKKVVQAKLNEDPPPPSTFTDGPLDDQLEALIVKATRRHAEKRQANMGRLVYELRALSDMLGLEREGRRRKGKGRIEGPYLGTPLPEFRVDLAGTIRRASVAFGDLVGSPVERLVGQALAATRLINVFPRLSERVEQAAESAAPVQEISTFSTEKGESATILIWIVPERNEARAVTGLAGVVVPVAVAEE